MKMKVSYQVAVTALLTLQAVLAADPPVDRAIQDAQKKYPPGDYDIPGKKAPEAASTTRSAEEIQTQTLFDASMKAVIAIDYDGFMTHCDATMKAALTKQMFTAASQQIASRTKQGYEAQYLGGLFQRGYKVHLWRLRFKDNGDDILATMSVKDGQVGGFYFH
jgi:hypothetical protein